MKILIIYDSAYGNTEKVAKAIAEELTPGNDVAVTKPKGIDEIETDNLNLLIIGSPTQAGRPLPSIQALVNALPADSLKNTKVAVFDTRVEMLIAKVFGYAADKIAKALKPSKGKMISPPAGFIVNDKEGPLKQGELDRAKYWAKDLLKKVGEQ
jgi:flavodoxin I